MNELLHLVKVIPEMLAISVGPKSAERWENGADWRGSTRSRGGSQTRERAPPGSLTFQTFLMLQM